LKNRLPTSKTKVSKPASFEFLTTVHLRARPPAGFFFQPQGSVSPLTSEVTYNLICDSFSIAKKKEITNNKQLMILKKTLSIFIPYIKTSKFNT
tara:strand:- start:45 stop:326 length:282 start_codon:yes stop_codon:yes gene_type:complete